MLTRAAVKNFTLRDRLYRLRLKVGVSYESDLSRVRRLLERVAVEAPWREQSKDPVVLLADFGASSVDYEVSVWTCDVWQQRQSMSMLRQAIWEACKEKGVAISFPQIDVHLDPPVSRAIASLGRAA